MLIIDGEVYNANVGKMKVITEFSVEENDETSGETLDGRHLADLKGTSLTFNIPLKTGHMTAEERNRLFLALAEKKVHTMVLPINGEMQKKDGKYVAHDVYISAGRRTDIMHWNATKREYEFDYSTISDITVTLQNYWRK